MPRVSRLALICLLAVGVPSHSAASAPTTRLDSSTVAVDSGRVDVRSPSDTLLARFRADPAFTYDEPEGWTWWRDFRRWVRAQLARLFGGNAVGGDVLQFVSYLFLAILVGYAAYRLIQLRSTARAPGRTSPDTIAHPQTAEEMHAIDFDARLEAAVADDDYRRAVRLLYQNTLQRLDRVGAVSWRPGKTNRAYVNELSDDLRPAFSTLTRLFERVWYGGATVDAERFRPLRAQFESFWARVPSSEQGAPNPSASSAPTTRDSHTADRSA